MIKIASSIGTCQVNYPRHRRRGLWVVPRVCNAAKQYRTLDQLSLTCWIPLPSHLSPPQMRQGGGHLNPYSQCPRNYRQQINCPIGHPSSVKLAVESFSLKANTRASQSALVGRKSLTGLFLSLALLRLEETLAMARMVKLADKSNWLLTKAINQSLNPDIIHQLRVNRSVDIVASQSEITQCSLYSRSTVLEWCWSLQTIVNTCSMPTIRSL